MVSIATFAYAEKNNESDVWAISQATISLVQAVTAAEQHLKSKATHAEFERIKQSRAYGVEVGAGKKVFDVSVDATTSKVISVTENKDDQKEINEKHDKKD